MRKFTWNYHLVTTFTESSLREEIAIGFQQSKSDHSLFTKESQIGTFTTLLVYVNDIIIGGNSHEEIDLLKAYLHSNFKIKELGPLKYFLGLEVARSSAGINICQRKYTLEILEDSRLLGTKPVSTPIELNHKLVHTTNEILQDPTAYRRLIRRLIYLTITRPDITYAVNVLSQFMDKPSQAHLHSAYRILKYLKGSIGQGIFLSTKSSLHLKAYSDFDWVACPETRRSVIGFCIFVGDSLVAIRITKNPIFHERTKHIELDCHFVREKVLSGIITPIHIASKFQMADIFIKALTVSVFQFLLSKMGILNIYAHLEGESHETKTKKGHGYSEQAQCNLQKISCSKQVDETQDTTAEKYKALTQESKAT
ncbi:uncharacterized mitochondrial protein AtMg00810-like [Carya illinoinensis]|uniref:uncharacterized mitochondrial protein AtMg00810-like n=1 Tax=Carya illinoinensis TaxID=32201 RepID=UPI001C71EC3B|nr:uncharacterized mitochondrial protein AtMg00810-like [Carya illinoinensis]